MTDNLFSLDDLGVTISDNKNVDVNFYEVDAYSRLVYLLTVLKLDLPTWLKIKLPFSNDLSKPIALWSALLKASYRKGESFGEGTVEEIKQCLDKVVSAELKTYQEKKRFWDYLNTLTTGLFTQNDECDLEDIKDGEEIEKFASGFIPFDICTEGFYQAIVTVAGMPGAGKTSLVLSFLGALVKNYPVWYFQTEIPAPLIKTRISLVKPNNIVTGSRIFCGNYTTENILDKIEKDPNKDRIIIYDSPEIKTSGQDNVVYFEKVYQDFVAMKMKSKLVVTTSQIKQNIPWESLDEYSLSDSASKGRYSDIILYVGKLLDSTLFKTAKNRFGPTNSTMVKYDYERLVIKESYLTDLF